MFLAVLRLRDERKKQKEEEDVKILEGGGDSSKESSVYDYGRNGDDAGEESDGFMEDRQTDEDYSAYRETMFDWSPRKGKKEEERKVLVEEIDTSVEENEIVGDFVVTKEESEAVQRVNDDFVKENENEASKQSGIVQCAAEGKIEQNKNVVEVEEIERAVGDENKMVIKEERLLETQENVESHNEIKKNKERFLKESEKALKEQEELPESCVQNVDVVLKATDVEEIENGLAEVVPKEELLEATLKNEASKVILSETTTPTANSDQNTDVVSAEELERWRKIRANYFTSDSSSEDDEKTDEPYYKILDVAEVTAYDNENTPNPVGIKNKLLFKSIKKNLTDIKELMDWNFKPHTTENKIILKPWDEEKCDDEEETDAFKLMESALNKKVEPEFEIKPPGCVVTENDVIRYAKNIKNSINIQNETVHRVLTTTKSIPIMQMQENAIVAQEDETEPVNSVIAAKGISQIRSHIAEFRENLNAFTNKYKQQYTALIQKYNDDCEKYDRNVRAFLKKEMEEKRQENHKPPQKPTKITEEEFTKQMESIVEEDEGFLLLEGGRDVEVERLERAHLDGQKFFENERERVRNINRTLEMQLAEDE